MNPDLVRQVWHRAQRRCEYCHMPAAVYPLPFHLDHIISRQHGGPTTAANLALSCLHCNRHKGPNIAGRDQLSGELVRLFDPRSEPWDQHFAWNGAELVGKTQIGRVTIQVLSINAPDFRGVREALIDEGVFAVD